MTRSRVGAEPEEPEASVAPQPATVAIAPGVDALPVSMRSIGISDAHRTGRCSRSRARSPSRVALTKLG